eukprot:720049-Pelagomonas_calceolata.AAC.2
MDLLYQLGDKLSVHVLSWLAGVPAGWKQWRQLRTCRVQSYGLHAHRRSPRAAPPQSSRVRQAPVLNHQQQFWDSRP